MNLKYAAAHPILSAKSIFDNYLDKKELRRLYSKIIKKDDLVFDIGANKGSYSRIMLSLCARVVAFEPHPDLVDYLKKRFRNNRRIVIYPYGIGAKKGKLKFNIASTNGHSSFKKLKNYTSLKKEIYVGVLTLRECIEKFGTPSFIKIDVEGFEYEVLKTLNVPIMHISFEFTSGSITEAEKCLGIINSLGNYEFNYCAEGHYGVSNKFASKKWMSSGELIRLIKAKNISGDIYARNSGQ